MLNKIEMYIGVVTIIIGMWSVILLYQPYMQQWSEQSKENSEMVTIMAWIAFMRLVLIIIILISFALMCIYATMSYIVHGAL